MLDITRQPPPRQSCRSRLMLYNTFMSHAKHYILKIEFTPMRTSMPHTAGRASNDGYLKHVEFREECARHYVRHEPTPLFLNCLLRPNRKLALWYAACRSHPCCTPCLHDGSCQLHAFLLLRKCATIQFA